MATASALILSTSHVPGPKDDTLGFTSEMPRVQGHEYGWMVFLTSDDARPVPAWFRPIRDAAVTIGAAVVIFDTDGHVRNFNTYDW